MSGEGKTAARIFWRREFERAAARAVLSTCSGEPAEGYESIAATFDLAAITARQLGPFPLRQPDSEASNSLGNDEHRFERAAQACAIDRPRRAVRKALDLGKPHHRLRAVLDRRIASNELDRRASGSPCVSIGIIQALLLEPASILNGAPIASVSGLLRDRS